MSSKPTREDQLCCNSTLGTNQNLYNHPSLFRSPVAGRLLRSIVSKRQHNITPPLFILEKKGKEKREIRYGESQNWTLKQGQGRLIPCAANTNRPAAGLDHLMLPLTCAVTSKFIRISLGQNLFEVIISLILPNFKDQ